MVSETGLRIGVLGRLLAARDGAAVKLPRGRTGVLLAVLAMSAARPVSTARLAELIWADEQPECVRASLHNLVARLRVLVPGAIVTVRDGYLLDIDPDQVDLLRFRRLAAAAGKAGAAGDPLAARRLLGQALELWRGEPLSDLRSAALDRDVIPGLIDEQLSAVQQRADLELAAGCNDQLIVELRALVGRYPLRESLWAQFLRALAGAGRPAEAIQEYHRVRELLAAELGVDPSPELRELYHQLLQGDGSGQSPTRQPIHSHSANMRQAPLVMAGQAPCRTGCRPTRGYSPAGRMSRSV